MGKIKDAIKKLIDGPVTVPADPPPADPPPADPPPADPAVEQAKVAAAKANFLKVSERFMAGGCTRAELDAAREAAGG